VDSGIGIPEAEQPKIFTKFFRADNVTGEKNDGTGLGLYLVKSMVEKIGGKIWFKSPAFAKASTDAKAMVDKSAGKPAATSRGTAFYIAFYPHA